MISLLLIILSDHAAMALTADTVVNPRVNLNWTSQTFIIPPGVFPNDTGWLLKPRSWYPDLS